MFFGGEYVSPATVLFVVLVVLIITVAIIGGIIWLFERDGAARGKEEE